MIGVKLEDKSKSAVKTHCNKPSCFSEERNKNKGKNKYFKDKQYKYNLRLKMMADFLAH